MNIERIKIEGLFGELNYDIPLKDNKLILVAENGSGKTTIVNLIYYFLSRQWNKLQLFKFKSVSAVIDGNSVGISKDDLITLSSEKIKRLTRGLPGNLRDELKNYLIGENLFELSRNPSKIEYLANRFHLSRNFVRDIYEEFRVRQGALFQDLLPEKQESLSNLINCQILYLPTFRRIEQELGAIFPHIESDLAKFDKNTRLGISRRNEGFVELVEFGMEDVRRKIRGKLEELDINLKNRIANRLTGGYLRDIINKTYLEISYDQIQEFSESALTSMLNRIDDSILSKTEKSKLSDFVSEISKQGKIEREETKIIAYFIYKMSTIYNELKKEEKDIEEFITICNEYSSNKQFVYDNINFAISIKPRVNGEIRENEEIELKELSSGEKQIVSLFSHLFLSQQKGFFLVIDEPELSLSVPWQERFLVDVADNPYCMGILAVTHSPFIFDNKLKGFAHGLNEFTFSS